MQKKWASNTHWLQKSFRVKERAKLTQNSVFGFRFQKASGYEALKTGFFRAKSLVFASLVVSATVTAQTPAGTVINNVATSALAVAAVPATATSNSVSLTVAAPPIVPVLTKTFSVASISTGSSAALTFTIVNPTASTVTGGAFTDNLPSGLNFTPAATAVVGGSVGCAATATFTANTMAVTGLTIPANGTCSITANSVSNAVGQSNTSCAANPAVFTNGGSNITAVVGLSNQVTAQCLVVNPLAGVASLTKAFLPSTIAENGAATLRFIITNSAGNPAQSGVGFVDTLPSGLRLTIGATATVTGAGCAATVTLTQPNVISAGALTMTLGTASCTVSVTNVTNMSGQSNASCVGSPAAFTNGTGRVTGATNLANNVTDQCLLVTPTPPPPGPDLPILTKAFERSSIVAGEWTALTFTLTPGKNPVNIGGYAFDDILPSGLAFRETPFAVMDGGCNGVISFTTYMPPQANIISVRDISIVDATKVCTVRVEGVTNRVGQLNPVNCGTFDAPDFTNTANRIDGIKNLVNGVTPQCLRVMPALPSLTKKFTDTTIYEGEVTSLVFTLRNTFFLPFVSGIAFVDNLPSGLRLTSVASGSVSGSGCSGVVNLSNNQISVSNLTILAGTRSCVVTVSGISNVANQFNPSCSGSPSRFTNSTVSIAGVINAYNFVEDACLVVEQLTPALDMTLSKSMSPREGYSPGGSHAVSIAFSNAATTTNAKKRNVLISDVLPVGMLMVPGSLRIRVGGITVNASAGIGSASVGARTVGYSSSSGQLQVEFSVLEPGDVGVITFDVNIAPGIARDTILTNVATLSFINSANRRLNRISNAVLFRVLGALGVRVTGQTITTADPGQTVFFQNTISNLGNVTDTYDISLRGSTFPAGSTITLLGSNGVTPLSDSNGNGVPDTGPIMAGGSATVIVRVVLPVGVAPGGPYRVAKTARSILDIRIADTDDDILLGVARKCEVKLEPNNSARVRPGSSVTYSHTLTNTGNCHETITGSLSGGATGWTGNALLDPVSSPNGNLAGAPSLSSPAASTPVLLEPGQFANYLVVVRAPVAARSGDVATHILSVSSSSTATPGLPTATRTLTNNDVTIVDPNATNLPDDIIRGFIDGDFRRPTLWTFIGRDFFIRANAPTCNALPDIIERRTIIITGPNGEREEIIAIETGPNTGIFDASIPVRLPPITPGNGTLEGVAFDTFTVEMLGCSRRLATTVTLIDPNGVVFDSRTNSPVAGATVRIVKAEGNVCTNTLAQVQALENGVVRPANSSVVTGATGRFDFPLVSPGDYCVQVQPPNGYTWTSIVPFDQLPAGRNVLAAGPTTGGSYGGSFRVGPETGPVILDIPVDAGMINGLFIRKEALRSVVELGEFADYTVTVNNQTGYALTQSDVFATDDLPAGFTYARGSARVDGKSISDPVGGGPRLVFNVGKIELGKQIKLTYRVRVGPGALQGDGINRVVAAYRVGISGLYSQSNVATAKVTVSAGVFSDRAYIVGKVYADCNKDHVQSSAKGTGGGEVGIPGVRLYLDDGTNIVTDGEGKYSFYGISPRSHVLKIDRTSLPDGVAIDDLAKLSNRNLGKGDSRFLDLKNGEIHKANFAVTNCSPATVRDIESRRGNAARFNSEIDVRLMEKLPTDVLVRPLADIRALPASGTVGQMPTSQNVTNMAVKTSATPDVNDNAQTAIGTAIKPHDAATVVRSVNNKSAEPIVHSETSDLAAGGANSQANPDQQLESILPEQTNQIGFIGLKTGDILPYAQSTIRVKGAIGTTFSLSVNGIVVQERQVGKRAVLESKQLQAWEYIGVAMAPGENEVAVKQIDQFGNPRGESKITLLAPGELAQIKIEFADRARKNGGAVADGKTLAVIIVKMQDKLGTPVTSRLPVTLNINLGRWNVIDVNPLEPGVQVFIEGGSGEFSILPPVDPGQAMINIESGRVRLNTPMDFLPDLREMIAVGMIEGVINLRKIDTRALVPTREQDAFEKEITRTARTWNDDKLQGTARASLFLKGKVKGEYLLTVAYDSDKDSRERLFRDIQPDQFYPVYGDTSTRGFDAQSTARLYLRVDNKKSYLLYGDFNTSVGAENRQLSNYNRSLTGVKHHYESGGVSANIFASRDSTKQVIEEFSTNGTSGPFTLTNTRGLINSEKLEVLTRDRNRTTTILRVLPLIRFVDYELESLTGRILLKAPIASLDENLNLQSLRITYEVDQGGPQFLVAGADAQVKISDRFEVGVSLVDDRNPVDKYRMMSVNSVAKIADKSFIIAEIVQTSREKFVNGASLGELSGYAKRIEFKRKDGDFDGNLFFAKSDAGFDNPNASLAKGRTEAGGKLSYRINDKTGMKVELLSTQDNATDAKRDGILLTFERTLAAGLRAELGMRHSRDTQAAQLPGNGGSLGQQVQKEVTTVRSRLTGEIPGVKGLSAYGEAEVDVEDSARKILAMGGEYQLPNKGRLYARHEFVSSITGPYGLSSQQRQNATVFGVNTDYMKDGNVFSEYRVRDVLSGGDAEAALGLRNAWTLANGIKLQTGFERVQTLSGVGTGESTAATFGLEYTASPLWKGSTRIEIRKGNSQDSILSTVALASKLNRNWTLLGRNTFSLLTNKGQTTGENRQDRLQFGMAYRDVDNDIWNAVGRIEHRTESDTTQPAMVLKRSVEMISLHANWQPRRPFTFSGRYAAKWVNDKSNGLATKNNVQLLAGRALWDIAPRWDVGVNASTMFGRGTQAKVYGLGIELGFLVMENLWISGGYNFFGYRDDDLASGEYTSKGVFIRLRYKFDEDLFKPTPSGKRDNASGLPGATQPQAVGPIAGQSSAVGEK